MQPITIFFAMILQMIIGMILGLTFSTELMGAVLLLAITRICWIDDNIHNDLLRRGSLPVSYRNTQIKRQAWLSRITGLQKLRESPVIHCGDESFPAQPAFSYLEYVFLNNIYKS